MKFLLINTNAAVRKIFSISARKAAIQLDNINSIADISLQEDYSCIFIDDGVLDLDSFQNLKKKLITTKFCLILSKDKAAISGFDDYIRKPFLPTDIYDVLKKEKYNEMSFSSYNDVKPIQQENPKDVDDRLPDTNVLDLDISNDTNNIKQHINDIDLSEFSDNDDEFLSGIKDTTPISFDDIGIDDNTTKVTNQNDDINLNNPDIDNNMMNDNDEINFTYSDDEDDLLNDNLEYTQPNNINIKDDDIIPMDTSFDLDSPEIPQSTKQESINIDNQTLKDNANDDIDFNSIFALQDEFLQSQQKNQPKGLVGGDIYTKKENVQSNPQTQQILDSQDSQESKQDMQNMQNMQDSKIENIHFDDNSNLNIQDTEFNENNVKDLEAQDISDFGDFNDFNTNDFNTDNFNADNFNTNDFNATESAINQNNIKNINDLSDEELDNLDDEALLRLQEESLNNDNTFNEDFNTPHTEPQILNKDTINELTNILEETMPPQNNLKIHNNELSSLTQEALSEVLDETNLDETNIDDKIDDFNFGDNDFIEEEQIPPNQPIENPIQNNDTNTHINIGDSTSNVNVDLSEIIKSLPIDKLRELLSGVQITINITFPSKKQ
ncbi:hypothetical protein CCY99_00625 [Helicobacter sp. 16-1353]|uniref:hypothetical protein n=1 Tax=Helicobacter sp. 16-1353 TaxID=2004996 RepID=UPI000DCC134E|nr:hypothetical protein [Helicobacter sp. 16-1353]RAX55237.1 hypothetical protein CCY99_00625 [Helicobacter sp. 16-1353]